MASHQRLKDECDDDAASPANSDRMRRRHLPLDINTLDEDMSPERNTHV